MNKLLNLKTILTIALSATAITACVGSSDSKDPIQQRAVAALNQAGLSHTQSVDINLYNSIFISPNMEYTYTIKDFNNKDITSGRFQCNPNHCLLPPINFDLNNQYLLSVFEANNNKFVGGAIIPLQEGTTYLNLSIDDASTSGYISQIMQNKLTNMFAAAAIEQGLFKPALNYVPSATLNTIIYAYYNFLAQTKSPAEAMATIEEQYKNCEKGLNCSLDADFIKNPDAVKAALNKADEVIQQHAKDKNDAQLYENYQWFKTNVADNFNTIKDPLKAGVTPFFPAAGGAIDGVGTVFSVVDTLMSSMTTNSKLAHDKLELFNSNLSKIYSAVAPNYNEIMREIGTAQLSQEVVTAYKSKSLAIIYNAADINANLGGLQIEDYFNQHSTETNEAFDWISTASGGDGLFGSSNTQNRGKDLDAAIDEITINNLKVVYKNIIDYSSNAGATTTDLTKNTIALRKAYNQALIILLQRGINALQYGLYADIMAATIRTSPEIKQLGVSNNYIKNLRNRVTFIEKSVQNTINDNSTYQDVAAQLRSKYSARLTKLRQNFQAITIIEKATVPQNVLQTVEIEGKCDINYSDGENEIRAVCPVYSSENGLILTKYIQSSLNKSSSQCLTTLPNNDGNIMYLADVGNFKGILGCMAPAPGLKQVGGWSIDKAIPAINSDFNAFNRQYISPEGGNRWNNVHLVIGNGTETNQKFSVSNVGINNPEANISKSNFTATFIESDTVGNQTRRKWQFTYSWWTMMGQTFAQLYFNPNEYKNGGEVLNHAEITANIQTENGNVILINNPNLTMQQIVSPDVPLIPSECTVISQNSVSLSFVGLGKQTTLKCGTDGKEVSRMLLDGGTYEYDAKANKLIMVNWRDWETSERNKYASNKAAVIENVKISDVYAGGDRDISCSDDNDSKNQLINEGREEFAASYKGCVYSKTGIFDVEHQVFFAFAKTRLPVPVKFDFNGTQRVNIWRNNPQGLYTFGLYGSDSVWDDLYTNYNYSQRDANIRGGWTDHKTGQLRVEYR